VTYSILVRLSFLFYSGLVSGLVGGIVSGTGV
jgi:hypothetical protein